MPRTKHPAPWLREEIWLREQGRCGFRDDGSRCGRTHDLSVEPLHPIEPGFEDDPCGYELFCRPHAELWRAIMRWDPLRRGFASA